MKKVWKAGIAGLAALSIGAAGFIGTTAAFAEEATKYTITVNNEVAGHTYEAYQVFSGTLSSDGKLGDIDWGSGISDEGKAALGSAKTKAEALSGKDYNSTEAKSFAKEVSQYLTTPAGTSTYVETPTKHYVINNLVAGYYLVKDQTGSLDNKDDQATSYLMAVVKNTDVTPKKSQPTVDKKVKDEIGDAEEGHDNGWGNSADHAINETFQFKLTASLPADSERAEYSTYAVTFHDTMSNGVTFEKINSVTVNGTPLTSTQYTPTTPAANAQGGTLTINIADLKKILTDITPAISIVVEYDAHLNEKAVISSAGDSMIANKNGVYLEYSNNPYATGTGKTQEKEVFVATFKMDNTKVQDTKDGAALAGAEFNLKDADGNVITFKTDSTDGYYYPATGTGASATLTSAADGTFNIKGLDAGTYTLVETKTPAGFNTMEDKALQIGATHKDDKVVTITGDTSNKIVNVSGSNLPGTGGMGTTMLYVAGGAIVLIAGIGMAVALRRRRA